MVADIQAQKKLKSWNISKTFIMEKKFEGENLIHLAGKKKKKKGLFGALIVLTTSHFL